MNCIFIQYQKGGRHMRFWGFYAESTKGVHAVNWPSVTIHLQVLGFSNS